MGFQIVTNYIEWAQIGTFSFESRNREFTIHPTNDGRWTLYSQAKEKEYIYSGLDQAFEGARRIADFYRD